MNSKSINVYGSLPDGPKDVPDDIASVCARLLNQYIAEDGLVQNDPGEHRLERLMRFAEMYSLRYLRVVKLHQQKGGAGVSAWQLELQRSFERHARVYQRLYQQISHMADPPYHMTNWSICYLVETSLDVCQVNTEKDFAALSGADVEMLDYVLRFGENLLQEFHAEFMGSR